MHKPEKIIVYAGTFNPLSADDVMYIKRARAKGDWIIIGVHTDEYIRETLKDTVIESYNQRRSRILSLKTVDEVFTFNDTDGTCINLLVLVGLVYPHAEIYFVTSDQGTTSIPETQLNHVKFINVK